MKIKCVKGRGKYDSFYMTGRWEPNEVREVDDAVGAKLLTHPSVWGDAGGAPVSAPSETDANLDVLDLTIPQIKDILPALTDDELAALMTAEEQGKTRKMLMAAFNEERERRGLA